MIADDLSRIAMSQSLVNALSRAVERTRANGHGEVTLEHMLESLCEDPDAGLVLAASNIDVARVHADVVAYLGSLGRSGQNTDPIVSADLRRILEAAAAAARGGRRREINGAIVLAAIVGDGKSPAAHMLQAQGMTFEGVIRALQHGAGAVPRAYAAPSTEDILASARKRVQSRSVPAAFRPGSAADYEETGEDFESAEPDEDEPALAPAAEPEEFEPLESEAEPQQAEPELAAPEPEDESQPLADDGYADDAANSPALPDFEPPPAAPARSSQTSDDARLPQSAVAPPPIPGVGAEPPWMPPPADSEAPLPPQPQLKGPGRVGGERRASPPPSAVEELLRPKGANAADDGFIGRAPRPQPGEQRPVTRPAPAPRAEIGQLVENIPRTMRVAVAVLVEVRIARGNVQALAEGLQGGGAAYQHEVTVTKAMSVRLRAPDGGFYIETASPETQWIEKTALLSTDDYASWRWHVTPREKGRKRLQLIISARTVSPDGLAAETALPDQVITVRVRTNYAKSLSHLMGWGVAALVGGLLARFGEEVLDAGLKIVTKVMNG